MRGKEKLRKNVHRINSFFVSDRYRKSRNRKRMEKRQGKRSRTQVIKGAANRKEGVVLC